MYISGTEEEIAELRNNFSRLNYDLKRYYLGYEIVGEGEYSYEKHLNALERAELITAIVCNLQENLDELMRLTN